jgi:molybdopterin converting factor small subunit
MLVRVRFTPQLRRFLEAPPAEVEASSAREALEAVFADHPRLRAYLLDEQGALNKHFALFIGGELARDADALDRPLATGQHLDLMQALSGG